MFKNLFQKSSKRIMKLSLALRALIGTISMAAYVQADIKLAFWFLVIGAVLDFVIQLLPPDTEIKSGAKILVGLVAVSVLCFSGCSKKVHPESSTVADTTSIDYKQVGVNIKGATVQRSVNIDSLFSVWLMKYRKFQADSTEASKVGKPIPERPELPKETATDPGFKAQLTYWIDQFGKLQVTCESKDQTIQMLIAEVTKARSERKTVYQTEYQTPVWNYAIIVLLGIALILSLFKR